MRNLSQLFVRILLCSILMTCFCLDPAHAAESKKGSTTPRRLAKTTVRDVYGSILINNIFNPYSNNGDGSHDQSGSRAGFEFPKGSGKTAIYEDGLVWGGKHNGVIKVGGSTYQHGLQPGRITTPGTPTTFPFGDNGSLEKYRLFRVRRDINPATSLEAVQDKINEELTLLNRYQSLTAEQVYNNYVRDWNEWPASDGAPFEDVNGNGSYDPGTDVPGVPGADQTLWHVSNDLDGGLTAGLYGSEPIGLEFQRTMWAYRSTGGLGSTIFVRYRIINLSGHPIDSMFVSQWSDPDVGEGGDDFVGCDTALSMGYAYNSSDFDQIYGATSPAVGYDFLQGPIVPAGSGDTAMFGGRYRFGYKNLPISSFNFFAAGGQYSDPPLGSPDGTRQWYNLMNGLAGSDGQEFVDPTTGQRTKFVLAGDPVNWTGWVDGMNTWQGDKRIVLSSGPFTMADRDTQEVVVCVMAAQGSDRLSSITALRSVDRIAQLMHNSVFTVVRPEFSCEVAYPTGTEATIAITGVGGIPRSDFIRISLHRIDGSAVGTVDLLDDGAHQDGFSGDGVFGGSITIPREPGAMTCDAQVFVNDVPVTFTRVLESITTAGDLELLGATVFSDNLNSDGFVNPGENIRYGFTILNNTMFNLNALSIVPFPGWGAPYYIGQLASGNQEVRIYDPGNDQSYFSFNASNSSRDTVVRIVLKTTDTLNNVWRDTLVFPIYPVAVHAYGVPVERVAGNGVWTFSTKVVDRTSLTNHLYEITIQDVSGVKHFSLTDLTSSTTLLSSHVLPDEDGHNIPLTDGFKILRGAVWGSSGVNRDSTRYFSGSPEWFNGYRFTQDPYSAFNGGVTTAYQLGISYLAHFASNFSPDNSVRVEVRFDAANPQKAYRMRRTGPNTEYQLQTSVLPDAPGGEPFVDVPFQVWDVSNPSSPRQLTVSWRDQNDNALWDPTVGSDGIEVVFIHFRTYDPLGRQFTYPANPDKPGPVVNDEATMGAEADIMYGLSLAVLPEHVLSESPGILNVHPNIGLTTTDRFVFQTEVVPAAPTLSSPAPGANDVNRQQRFMWNPSEGADFYTLQVSRDDSLFRYLIHNDSTLATTYSPTDTTGTSLVKLDWGTKYYWRVNGRNPYGVSAWSGMRSFTTGLASVPSSWNYASLTGRNATVAIPLSSHPSIGRRAMQTGDAIGLFYMRNDTMICAGYGSWKDGSNLVVTIWGDNDQTTTIKDGFAEGEQLTYRAWDAIAGRYFPATVTYESGGPTFATDGIYLLSSFTANTNAKHSIPLPQGWNMISTCLIPNDSSLTSVLVDALPSIVLLKNGRGQVFWPSLSVNTIGKWNPLHGYQIYTTSTDTVWVCGDEAVPQSIPVYLQRGWNLTAYLRTTGLEVDTALATIRDYLVIVKNNFGEIFAPSLGINTLGHMKRGQGYQMYLTNNATLVYPANTWFAPVYLLPGESPPPGVSTQSTPTRFVCSLGPTGSNAILVTEWEGFHDGDEVAVWNSDRKLIGSAVARNGKAIITVWGDNVMTDKVIDGAREEEPLKLSLWSPKTDRLYEISNVGITNLLDAEEKIPGLSFRQDAFWKVHLSDAGTIPTTMVLAQNYPNPFNPSTVIRYGIPFNSKVVIEVFNVLGQRVTTLVDTEQGAGFYEVTFEGYRYASGVYIYRMRAGSFIESKKMMILR